MDTFDGTTEREQLKLVIRYLSSLKYDNFLEVNFSSTYLHNSFPPESTWGSIHQSPCFDLW